jgi:hypothetical protein
VCKLITCGLFFLCSGGQKRLFESPSDAREQKKDIPVCGFESRMRLLRNVPIVSESYIILEMHLGLDLESL